MTAKEFVVDRLYKLVNKFDGITIRYEFRIETRAHIVEVNPVEFYQNNSEYRSEETSLEKDFESKYPDENIIFISEGSLIEIQHPEYRLFKHYRAKRNILTNLSLNQNLSNK